MQQQEITLYSPGALPGIPGEEHPAGVYTVDWSTRSIVGYRPLPMLATSEPPVESSNTPSSGGAEAQTSDTETTTTASWVSTGG